jgi:hypothetical protein
MTICLYQNDTLYTNRSAVVVSSPSYYSELKKLHVSSCERAAIAVTGDEVPENFVEQDNFKRFLDFVLKSKHDSFMGIKTPEEFTLAFTRIRFLIMSRSSLYKWSKGELVMLSNKEIAAVGSGSFEVTIACIAGKEPLEAIRIAALCELGSYLTDIDSIHRSLLRE